MVVGVRSLREDIRYRRAEIFVEKLMESSGLQQSGNNYLETIPSKTRSTAGHVVIRTTRHQLFSRSQL
jgi:D-ribose pyranose/furanose isomerase RbsD